MKMTLVSTCRLWMMCIFVVLPTLLVHGNDVDVILLDDETLTWTLKMTMNQNFCDNEPSSTLGISTIFYRESLDGGQEEEVHDEHRTISADCHDKVWEVELPKTSDDGLTYNHVNRIRIETDSSQTFVFSSISLSVYDEHPNFSEAEWWQGMGSNGAFCLSMRADARESLDDEDCHSNFDFTTKQRYDMILDSYNEEMEDGSGVKSSALTQDEITMELFDADGNSLGRSFKSDIHQSINYIYAGGIAVPVSFDPVVISFWIDQHHPTIYDVKLSTNGDDAYFIDHAKFERQWVNVYYASDLPRKNRASFEIAQWGSNNGETMYSYCLSKDTEDQWNFGHRFVPCIERQYFCVFDCKNSNDRHPGTAEEFRWFFVNVDKDNKKGARAKTVRTRTWGGGGIHYEDSDAAALLDKVEFVMWYKILPFNYQNSHLMIDVLGGDKDHIKWLCISRNQDDLPDIRDRLVGNKCYSTYNVWNSYKITAKVADSDLDDKAGTKDQLKLSMTTIDGGEVEISKGNLDPSDEITMFSATAILEFDFRTDGHDAVLFKGLLLEKIHLDPYYPYFPWNEDVINERNFVDDGHVLCLSKDERDYTWKQNDPDLQFGKCVANAFFGGPGDDGGYWEVVLRAESSEQLAGTKDDIQLQLLAPGSAQVTKSKHLTFERGTVHVIKSDTRIDKIRLLASGGDALLLGTVEVWYVPLMTGEAQRIVDNWVPDGKALCLSTDPSDFASLGDKRAYNLCSDNWTLNIRKYDDSI